MRKLIFFIILLILLAGCSSYKGGIKTDIIKDEISYDSASSFTAGKVFPGDNIIFYTTQDNSKGDIWLYNLSKNSKWQITFINSEKVKIKFVSPDYSYLLYSPDGINDYIADLNLDTVSQVLLDTPVIHNDRVLLNMQYINSIGSTSFFCVATPSTNRNISLIFKVYRKNEQWVATEVILPDEYNFLKKTKFYNVILSPDKQKLAFINNNESGKWELYVYDLNQKIMYKLYGLKSVTDLVWDEESESVYFSEEMSVYEIDFKKFTKLLLTENNEIVHLIPHPRQNFKFFYVTQFENYFFIYIKNTDVVGKGKFLFNHTDVNHIKISQSGNKIFWDNKNREIYYFDVKTSVIKKILDNSSLYTLNNE